MPKKKRCYRTQEIAQERNGVTEEEEGREGIVCTCRGWFAKVNVRRKNPQSLGGLVVIKVGVRPRNVDGPIFQVCVVRWKRG